MAIKKEDFEQYIQQRQLPSKDHYVLDKENYFFSEIAVEKCDRCWLTQEKSSVTVKGFENKIT